MSCHGLGLGAGEDEVGFGGETFHSNAIFARAVANCEPYALIKNY